MTKIVFNNNNDGYVQGMRPNAPAHSELRRTEERKECVYTDQRYGFREQRPVYDYREPAEECYRPTEMYDRQPPQNDRYVTPNERARSYHKSKRNTEGKSFSDMVKGVPLWAISAINCSMGMMTLFIPCLVLNLNTGRSGSMGYYLNLLSLMISQNNNVVAEYTTAQVWQIIIPTLISAAMAAYFLLMRENSYKKAYIPAVAGIASIMMTIMYFIAVENSTYDFLFNVECGFGVYVLLASSLMMIILSIVAIIASRVGNKDKGFGRQMY